MSKPFIALYKAYRGGEWFGESLRSVARNTDGAVVVLSNGAWVDSVSLPENCSEPLAEFQKCYPDYPVSIWKASCAGSSEQYDVGLAAVVERFGPEAAVLVVDTDEIWTDDMLAALRSEVEQHPEIHYFRSAIYTYLRSPLYRVWPQEKPNTCVALQHAQPQPTHNRFAVQSRETLYLPDIAFHHFSYVRLSEDDLRCKFVTTSSQESRASDESWWNDVWPYLPDGTNLHMTPGSESCWGEIQPIVPDMLPPWLIGRPAISQMAEIEDARWRDWLRRTPPKDALIPVPTDKDATKYSEHLMRYIHADSHPRSVVGERMKTTYLESLWLAYWASMVPNSGRIMEIGCGSGGSTAVLAMASDSSVAIQTVDPFEPYNEQTHAGTVRGVREGNEAEFWDTARYYGYDDRIDHLKKSSIHMPAVDSAAYDLIFVDGNHTEEFVRHDLALSWGRLKPGGILIAHDYTTRFPGVIQAVDEMETTCNFRTPGGTSLAYARKTL